MVDLVDQKTVCCMCGDIGFPDKLFRCNKCRHRFQHSYCSSHYSEFAEQITMCDWCLSEGRNGSKHGSSSEKRAEFSGRNTRQLNTVSEKPPRSSGTPSPRRASPRKYKLLKDVMC